MTGNLLQPNNAVPIHGVPRSLGSTSRRVDAFIKDTAMSIDIAYTKDGEGLMIYRGETGLVFNPILPDAKNNHIERFVEEMVKLYGSEISFLLQTRKEVMEKWIDWCETTRCPDCGCEVELIEVEEMTARSGCINPDDIGFTTHLTEGCPCCGEPVS